MENINEFNYKSFFDNIDNISHSQVLKLIQNETNNFDVFLVSQFFTEFYNLVLCYKIDRIKFSDIDLTFSDDIENNRFSDDNSLLSYIHYRLEKGKLTRKKINVKFKLIEPIDPKYFMSLYNVLYRLESIILNHATKEQLSSLDILPQQPEPEPEPLDLSDTSAVEKIIYLNELGIIDFLRLKTKVGISNGGLASLLSGITGINPDTIKSSLNRLPKDYKIDNKHPYYTTKTVDKVKKQLRDLGF